MPSPPGHFTPCPRSAGTSPAQGTETRSGPRPRCRGQMVAPAPLSPPATLGGPSAGKPSREGTKANGNARGQPRAPRRHQGRARLVPPAPIPCASLLPAGPPPYVYKSLVLMAETHQVSLGLCPPAEGSQTTPHQSVQEQQKGRIPPLLHSKSLQGAHSYTPCLTHHATAVFARSWDRQNPSGPLPRPCGTQPGASPLRRQPAELGTRPGV